MPNFISFELWMKELAFLGHVVSSDGIKVDPKKTGIVNWPKPLPPSNVRSFLDLDSYYWIFIEGFSSIQHL